MEFKDYYRTLGVSKSSSDKEIKQAFRKLARKHHPDVNPGDKTAEAKFKEINEAYEVLGDPAKRRKYDELGANWRMYEQAQQQGQPWPGAQDFGGGGPQAGGRQRGGRAPRGLNGRDIESEVELTLEEAFHGATRRVSIKQDGHARSVDVRIPAGVKDGSRVRAAGEGEAGSNGGAAGDLYLRVRLRPHPVFERRGNDLHAKVAVPVTTAVLGGEAQVPTITGQVRLKIPETTQNGQVFRLKGHGMPTIGKPDERGDLYAYAEVQLPRTLTKEQRQHYEALAKTEK
jgi:DnaJ-class molecular chaperone